MKIQKFTFNPLQENTYILFDETNEAILIDPGCYEEWEKNEISEFVDSKNLKLKLLLNTHCHVDHVLGNFWVSNTFHLPLSIYPIELETLRAVKVYAPVYGFAQYQELMPESFFNEHDIIKFGNTQLEIIHVPGHSPGHVVFINHAQKEIIAGDVLFHRSIGRTDLPGGNHTSLITNIQAKLFKLDDNYKVFPGHGPMTTIGDEKKYNPFLN
ncbi:MAG: MBL fold metallo-hydrolase [Bacteroidota bacterium]|nr:MBL fold metallo-hydrolase [Bacteroidota bacterium]